jgi:hypothetical protein
MLIWRRFAYSILTVVHKACGIPGEPLPDVDEVVRDHETNPVAVDAHVRMIIDRIIELTPQLANRLLLQKARSDRNQDHLTKRCTGDAKQQRPYILTRPAK